MRVLIAGGGVAALEALLALRDPAGERVEIELLSPSTRLEYRPLAVAEPFGPVRSRSYDLDAIASEHGAKLRQGGLAEVVPSEHLALTREGEALGYDVLLVTVGARAAIGLPGAITIKGPRFTRRFRALLAEVEDGRVHRVAFALPPGASWPLPLYELALMTRSTPSSAGCPISSCFLVTSEASPLELFGSRGSAVVRDLFEERGIELVTGRRVVGAEEGLLRLVPPNPQTLPADRLVSLPRLRGPGIAGLPTEGDGFLPTDLHGRLLGTEDVYAAGDATAFAIKQGGLATQQADAAAEAIAASAGAPVDPAPFRPVLRGMLLTGEAPRYMRAEVSGEAGTEGEAALGTLWWPPSKIAGRYISPFLGVHHEQLESEGEALPIEVELHANPAAGVRRRAVISPRSGLLRSNARPSEIPAEPRLGDECPGQAEGAANAQARHGHSLHLGGNVQWPQGFRHWKRQSAGEP